MVKWVRVQMLMEAVENHLALEVLPFHEASETQIPCSWVHQMEERDDAVVLETHFHQSLEDVVGVAFLVVADQGVRVLAWVVLAASFEVAGLGTEVAVEPAVEMVDSSPVVVATVVQGQLAGYVVPIVVVVVAVAVGVGVAVAAVAAGNPKTAADYFPLYRAYGA
jgi:hypothetical protein